MSQDAAELHVASDGSVSAAPVGTSQPASPTTTPDGAFLDLGYMTEDGVTFTETPTVEDILAWQSPDPIRRLVTTRSVTAAFSAQQVNQENFVFAFGGGSWSSPSSGVYKYSPPSPNEALAESALLIRSQDGSKNNQYGIYRGNITEAVETQLQRSAPQQLPVTFSALTPTSGGASWEFVTDDSYAFGFLT